MSISQLQIDVSEFILNNSQEIKEWINEEIEHMRYCEVIFKDNTDLFDEMLEKARESKLKECVQAHFSLDGETLSLIFDERIVKLLEQV